MTIGILTTFANMNPEFSLCSVVKQQLSMLVKHGHKPVLFTLNIFKDEDKVPKGVEVRKVIPQLILEPYAANDLKNLDEDVEKAMKAMEKHMVDIDVCLTHDIIFINSYLPYNIAMREAQETKLGHVKFLHWMHSGPSLRPSMDGSPYDNLFTLPQNSRLIYMNYTDVIRAAEMYGVMPKDVRTIFNPMDIRELYEFHPLTKELIDKNDLMSPDYLCVYPLSTTRMDRAGKQLSKVIWIMAGLKSKGASVRLVVPNAHANADREKREIERMYKFAELKGLERKELVFTSLHDKEWEHGVPHEVVRNLFTLGNLFIFPSVSENCPLILLEAMAGKNILVLNQSFPAMKDFGGNNALYFRFSSLIDKARFPLGKDEYMEDIATIIISEMTQNKAVAAQTNLRQKFNVDYIWKQQLLPAIKEINEE